MKINPEKFYHQKYSEIITSEPATLENHNHKWRVFMKNNFKFSRSN
uniref:Uncharacterized protein n=2 Tax=Klebsiella/Raoultella group TaxID=2890311 RepID=W8CT73_RAOPL|nr:hypothetical protein pKpNDM1_00058 [Raoultella planticola]QJS00314.1 hypothetical protein [Klebsiella quasipneumoniae]QZX60285.1 hypothetical protein [Klebsiella michiganensis]UGK55176.1 Hypothetical protein [Raoultella ornithinolytica]UWX38728.1 hypothetical protein KK467_p2100 [Klebsiella pneumoniae]